MKLTDSATTGPQFPAWVLESGYRYIRIKYPPITGKTGIYHPVGYQGASLEEAALGLWHDIEPPKEIEGDK